MTSPDFQADLAQAPVEHLPLPSPQNVCAEATSCHRIAITWEPLHGADCYVVYRSCRAVGDYAPIGQVCCCCFSDAPLARDSTWFYRVAAWFGPRLSPQSAFAAATTCPDCCCRLPC